MKEYITVNDYCRKVFGCKVYKIALSCSKTCPNRDGTKGTGGCIFCSAGGSGDFAADINDPVSVQITTAIKRLGEKGKACKYIAYFQSFTGTYGDINELSRKFYEAIAHEDIVGLSIATRPDCLSDDIMRLLTDLSEKTQLWIELGLQTVKETTAEYINRCYPLSEYDSAIAKLRKIKCHIVTHVILGLPGETKTDILNTVRYASERTDGIKLQLLHVLRGTPLSKDYIDNKFKVLSLEEYCEILSMCLEVLPDRIVIHRLTGDAPKKDLIAPLWSADKKHVLAEINRAFAARGIKHKSN